jgi:hypothetical protein
MLYGYFVRSQPSLMAAHRPATVEPCISYWDDKALNLADIEVMLRRASESQVAFSAASFSKTPQEAIRSALANASAKHSQYA